MRDGVIGRLREWVLKEVERESFQWLGRVSVRMSETGG